MKTGVASHHYRSTRHLRGWAMMCTALALSGSAAWAQIPPAPQTAAQAAAASEAAAIPVLDKAQLDALLATPDKVLFLDVRRADEVSSIGGFPVFLNIQAAELDRFLAYIPRDRKIITVSNHAHRGQAAGALLKRKGFKVVGAAGVQDYEAQGGVLSGKKVVADATPGVAAQAPSVAGPGK